MSTSHTPKTFVALLFCTAALLLAGCGQSGQNAGENAPNQQAPDDLSGALSPTDRAPGTPRVQPTDTAGAAAEATDFAPVDIQLEGGRFAKGTPPTIHVPEGFIIVVSARADDSRRYRLGVQSPSVAQTFFVEPGEEKKITLDAMRQGQRAQLLLGKQSLTIAADAEPGP